MAADKDPAWVAIYQTPSQSDADLVRMTLEVAGYRVWVQTGSTPGVVIPGYDAFSGMTVSVPADDADDARDYLKQKTSLLPHEADSTPPDPDAAPPESPAEVAQTILEVRRQHEIAACKYCGIATLDIGEMELDSRMIALLRAAGLGVNTATFSEFEAGERICTECAGHEVECDVCGRVLDAFLDEGEYQQAKDDEAYVCSGCRGRLEDQLQADRDW
jgi:hypothetical protein